MKEFFDHLKVCGGCLGPRTFDHCDFAGHCAVIEIQKRKGLIQNSMDYGYPVGLDITIDDTTPLIGPGNATTYTRRGSFVDFASEQR